MKKNKAILVCTLYSVLCILLVGCRPHGILHSWEMREVLCDLHKTDAMMQLGGISHGKEEARRIYYAQVLERHGVTQAEFDSSLVWYTAHPQLFDKIYPRVMKELKAQEDAFTEAHRDELAMFNPYAERNKNAMKERTVFTRADMDSVLWVTQHGYSSSWTPRPTKPFRMVGD